jgi:hypothetical protein
MTEPTTRAGQAWLRLFEDEAVAEGLGRILAIEAEARAEAQPEIAQLHALSSDALLQLALAQEALGKVAEEGCTGCEFNADDPDGEQPDDSAWCNACIARVALLAAADESDRLNQAAQRAKREARKGTAGHR